MAKLALRHCTPIKKGTKPISASIARSLIKQLSSSWSFSGDTNGLEQEFRFKNFYETMGFVNAVAWIANNEDHHPDLEVSYNRCKITLTTHAAGGLTVNDFICAAKIDALYQPVPEVTAEKTQAIAESRAKTGSIPQLPAKSPELNMSEAEELLSIEIKAPAPEPTMLNEEFEIKLTDPEDDPTQPHLQNPQAGSAPSAEIAGEPAAAAPYTNPEPAPEDPATATDQAEGRFLTTVILPPGMQRVHDKDEEATVISQPNLDLGDNNENKSIPPSTANDSDEVKTMIISGLPEDKDDLTIEEDSDMMKTMIMKAPLLNEDDVLNSAFDGDETLVINPRSPDKNKFK